MKKIITILFVLLVSFNNSIATEKKNFFERTTERAMNRVLEDSGLDAGSDDAKDARDTAMDLIKNKPFNAKRWQENTIRNSGNSSNSGNSGSSKSVTRKNVAVRLPCSKSDFRSRDCSNDAIHKLRYWKKNDDRKFLKILSFVRKNSIHLWSDEAWILEHEANIYYNAKQYDASLKLYETAINAYGLLHEEHVTYQRVYSMYQDRGRLFLAKESYAEFVKHTNKRNHRTINENQKAKYMDFWHNSFFQVGPPVKIFYVAEDGNGIEIVKFLEMAKNEGVVATKSRTKWYDQELNYLMNVSPLDLAVMKNNHEFIKAYLLVYKPNIDKYFVWVNRLFDKIETEENFKTGLIFCNHFSEYRFAIAWMYDHKNFDYVKYLPKEYQTFKLKYDSLLVTMQKNSRVLIALAIGLIIVFLVVLSPILKYLGKKFKNRLLAEWKG